MNVPPRETLENMLLELLDSVAPFDTVRFLLGEMRTTELVRVYNSVKLDTLSPADMVAEGWDEETDSK